MKRSLKPVSRRQALSCALLVPVFLSACSKDNEKSELMVFAAASLSESLSACAEAYAPAQADLAINFNFDSSGSLAKQIAEGAETDLFISAGQKQMTDLLDKKRVIASTKLDLLANKLCLCSNKLEKDALSSFDDFVRMIESGELLLSIGGPDVPAGQYATKLLTCLGLNLEKLQETGKISLASNVKEVAAQIEQKSVDCGFIYTSDAKVEGLEPLLVANEQMTGPIHYPAALCSDTKLRDEAEDFLKFLTSSKAKEIFERFGFAALD